MRRRRIALIAALTFRRSSVDTSPCWMKPEQPLRQSRRFLFAGHADRPPRCPTSGETSIACTMLAQRLRPVEPANHFPETSEYGLGLQASHEAACFALT